MLEKLFLISPNYSFLHNWAQLIAVNLEVPLFRFLLKIFCDSKVSQIELRHSIVESSGFNLFVSDIDLTIIISNESQSTHVLNAYHLLKKIFMNLGEPEVVTCEERDQLLKLETAELKYFWSKLFQLRKIHWQLLKKKQSKNNLELLKIARGLEKCKSKLGSESLVISIERAFPESPKLNSPEITYPYYSHYLGCWVEIGASIKEHALVAQTEEVANGFLSLLPDYELQSLSQRNHFKTYITQREIVLSQAQRRLLESNGKSAQHISEWILKLKEKISK